MMKRNILAVVIPALLAATTANAAEVYNKNGNKLDLYGRIDGLHYFSSNDSQNGDQSYARFGFNGETQVNDQLTGYGQWEYQIGANLPEYNNDNGFTRLGYGGLKSAEYGSLDYGRNYGIVYDVGGYTDVLPEFGGDAVSHTDNFMNGRTNNVLTYRNNGLFGLVNGLNLGLQFQGKNNNRHILEQNGDGFGASLGYDLGNGINAIAAMSNSVTTTDQQAHGAGHNAETYAGGLRYNANNLYLATTYGQSRNGAVYGTENSDGNLVNGGFAKTSKNFEAVAQYAFDFGLTPSLAYLQSKGQGVGTYGSQDLLKYIDLGSTYNFNKNLSTYVDYKINLLNDNDFTKATNINTDNVVGAGLVYQF